MTLVYSQNSELRNCVHKRSNHSRSAVMSVTKDEAKVVSPSKATLLRLTSASTAVAVVTTSERCLLSFGASSMLFPRVSCLRPTRGCETDIERGPNRSRRSVGDMLEFPISSWSWLSPSVATIGAAAPHEGHPRSSRGIVSRNKRSKFTAHIAYKHETSPTPLPELYEPRLP